MLDSTGGDFLRCYTDALQIIPHDLQHLISNYLQSDLHHQQLLSFCNQIAADFSETNGSFVDESFTKIRHSLLAMQDICDRRISLVNEMEDLLERQTHALFISGGRLNTTNAAQTGALVEENCPRLLETGVDGGGSFERRPGETDSHAGPDSRLGHQDMYPNLKASLLRHAIGSPDHHNLPGVEMGDDEEEDTSAAWHSSTSPTNSHLTSSPARWPLSRWSEARLYQRKAGLGLTGAHKMALQSFRHRRPSDQLCPDTTANRRQLHKANHPRYSRAHHKRFKSSQQHSFSRALYTNRSRTRRLNEATQGNSDYSSKRPGFPVFTAGRCKLGGYYYPPEDSQTKEAVSNESDDDDDDDDNISEPRRLGVDTFWHFDPSLRHKEFACKQYGPHEEGPAIRGTADDRGEASYYVHRKSTTVCSSGRMETNAGVVEDDDNEVDMAADRGRRQVASSSAVREVKSISRSSRHVRHHASCHGLARNGRRRHFAHEPAHRRRRLLKSCRSRKLIASAALTGRTGHSQRRHPEQTSEAAVPGEQGLETGPQLAMSRPEQSEATRNRPRHHQGPPRLSCLRVRSENHCSANEGPQSARAPVVSISVSPTAAGAGRCDSAATTPLGGAGLPTLVGVNLSGSHPRSRLRSLGEHRGDKSRSNNSNENDDDDESDESVASPDERLYCLCRKVSFGDMIACDNKRCELEWFHFACVDIRVQPKGKWYCPFCRGENSRTRRTDT